MTKQAASDDADRKTWTHAVAAWAPHVTGNIGPQTAKRYAVSLGQVEPWLKSLYLEEITRKTLATMIRDRKEAGASHATIRRDLTAISSVLHYAISNEWIEANPTLVHRRDLKERRNPIVLPEIAEIEFAISRAPGNMAHMIFAAVETGCRQDELVTAQRPDLDRAGRLLTVTGKGNKRRVIELDENVCDRLA